MLLIVNFFIERDLTLFNVEFLYLNISTLRGRENNKNHVEPDLEYSSE